MLSRALAESGECAQARKAHEDSRQRGLVLPAPLAQVLERYCPLAAASP